MLSELAELRRKAAALDVPDWEDLTRDQLAEAVAAAEAGGSESPEPESEDTMPAATPTRRRRRAAEETEEAPRRRRTTKAAATAEKPAKARATKKVAKISTRRAEQVEGGGHSSNPFRTGSNLWHITEALIRGGVRADLVAEVKPLLSYKPRVQDVQDFDTDAETDRRLKVVGYILKNRYGWTYTHEGRGPEAFIQCLPPS